MDLCKLCQYEIDDTGVECELKKLVRIQAAGLGIQVIINMCNSFKLLDIYSEDSNELSE